jgi:hypothetical protein
MSKGKIQRVVLGLIIAAVVVPAGALAALAVAQMDGAEAPPRADILTIDGLKAFGPLERPPVLFYHDKHTQALAKQNKDCLACHKQVEDRLALKFNRTEDVDKQTTMDIYHDACIGCHRETAGAAEKSGPVSCGQCHVQDPVFASNRQPIALDRSLHYRHVKSMEKKCEQCHHEYNPQTQKLYYAKGQEGACLYCHKEQTEENRISNRLASHQACISCHRQRASSNQDAGPIECAGCHDPQQQDQIEKLTDVPRMERNQPDAVLVRVFAEDGSASNPGPDSGGNPGLDPGLNPGLDRMQAVAFDHKAHETYNNSCRVCHHASLQSCAACHTIAGKQEGQQVKLAQAMHQKDAGMSCVGCHNQQKAKPECAGCHHSIPPSRTLASESACQTCHAVPVSEGFDRLPEEQTRAMAAEILAARQPVRFTVPADQIPETVKIQKLSDQYEAAVFPHRKIVLKLAEVNTRSQMAAYYHSDPLTLCQGCHHNSPAALKPPQCASCHGRSSEALNLTRPGLMAAYHQQCIECHEQMGLEKPPSRDCVACHAKRK